MDNRERIIDGAVDLFRKFGIRSVTMDSVANHLGISKRTIYENFTDKDDLVAGILNRMHSRHRELLEKILEESGNPIEAIFRVLEMNKNHYESISPVFQADLKKFLHNLNRKKYKCDLPDYSNHQTIIENGIKDGYFRSDVDPDLANRCLYYLGTSIMNYELYPYETFKRKDVIRNTFINYLRGISTPKGYQLIDKHEAEFIRLL